MAQVFRHRANAITVFLLLAGAVLAAGVPLIATLLIHSSYATGAGHTPDQPVPFSHEHHVGQLGLDCRYCHDGVESSAVAGLPATEVCMTCHSQLFTDADMLAPVRHSLETGAPLRWNRVHDLPDFVYFNHSIHIANGVGCETCHGEVDDMPLISQVEPLTMQWCLDCHRDPAPNLRPRQEVFTMHWRPPKGRTELGKELMALHDIHPENMTDCYVCHR